MSISIGWTFLGCTVRLWLTFMKLPFIWSELSWAASWYSCWEKLNASPCTKKLKNAAFTRNVMLNPMMYETCEWVYCGLIHTSIDCKSLSFFFQFQVMYGGCWFGIILPCLLCEVMLPCSLLETKNQRLWLVLYFYTWLVVWNKKIGEHTEVLTSKVCASLGSNVLPPQKKRLENQDWVLLFVSSFRQASHFKATIKTLQIS